MKHTNNIIINDYNNNNNENDNDTKVVLKVPSKLVKCRHNNCTFESITNHRRRHERSFHCGCTDNSNPFCSACELDYPRGRKSKKLIMMENLIKAVKVKMSIKQIVSDDFIQRDRDVLGGH